MREPLPQTSGGSNHILMLWWFRSRGSLSTFQKGFYLIVTEVKSSTEIGNKWPWKQLQITQGNMAPDMHTDQSA